MSTIDRRDFMESMGHALALGTLSGISPLVQAGSMANMDTSRMLVLFRPQNEYSAAFARQLAQAGANTIALHGDVVRQWRDGIEHELANSKKLLLGLGNWDDFVIVSQLAIEQRRFPLLSLQHPIQPVQQKSHHWAQQHAQELLALIQQQDVAGQTRLLSSLVARHNSPNTTPSLFSWIIG